MKTHLFLLQLGVVFLLSFTRSFGQKSQMPGYYISLNGDTIKGTFINVEPRGQSPRTLKFKATANGEIEISTENSKVLNIYDVGIFVPFNGKRLTNSIDFQTATDNDKDQFEDVSAFIKLIAQTKEYRFFSFADQNRINLFYQKNDGQIKELEQKGALRNNAFWQSMTFKQQLREAFPLETSERDFENLSYTESSLAAFVKKHGGENALQRQKNQNEGFFILAGASINSFEYTGTSSPDFAVRSYKSKTVPVLGLGYMFSLQTRGDMFFLSPQLKVYSYKHEAHVVYNNSYPTFTTRFQSSVIVSPGLYAGFKLVSAKGLKIFVMPGVNILFLGSNKQIEEAMLSASETKVNTVKLKSAAVMVNGQAMAMIGRKLVAWASYNLPTNVSGQGYRANLSSIQLGLGYKFF